jgi:RHS repeat-associated protein
VTDTSASVVKRYDYAPFGEEILAGNDGRTAAMGYQTATDGVNPRFTGKERDAETGLDYFGARYYSGAQGRFTSPDQPGFDQWPVNPQSWNLFGFVRNNPLSFLDPNGSECKRLPDGPNGEARYEGDCSSAGDEKVTESDKAQQTTVTAQEGSTLEYLFAPPVPRYVPDDKPLGEKAHKVLAQVGKKTAPIAIAADCAAESYLPFSTAAGGESVWQLGRDTVPKPFAAGGNPYTSQLSIGSRSIFGSKGGGLPSIVRGADGTLRISSTSLGGFVGRILGPLGRATAIAGLALGVYQTTTCVARY